MPSVAISSRTCLSCSCGSAPVAPPRRPPPPPAWSPPCLTTYRRPVTRSVRSSAWVDPPRMPPNASVSPATSRDAGLVEPGVARVGTKLAGATCGSGPPAIDAFIDDRDEDAGVPKDANAPGEMAGAATVAAVATACCARTCACAIAGSRRFRLVRASIRSPTCLASASAVAPQFLDRGMPSTGAPNSYAL